MAKGFVFETDLLELIFNGTAIAGIAENAASGALTQFWFALHTADPTGGDQTTHEATYTGYARVPVARNGASFVVSGSNPAQAALAANLDFPPCTGGGPETETYFSIGVASAGASKMLYSGPISPNIVVANAITPRLSAGTKCTERNGQPSRQLRIPGHCWRYWRIQRCQCRYRLPDPCADRTGH